MQRHGREVGSLPYWVVVAVLLILGVLSLPSIGWLLIAIAIVLVLIGGVRSKRAVTAPIAAALLALIVAFLLLAPGLCIEGVGDCPAGVPCPNSSYHQCRSLAWIPLGGENWIPFAVLGPVLMIAAVVLVRRTARQPH